MVDILGGTFEMGCSPEDNYCDYDEYPRHTVTVSPFKISAYEITQGQWITVMGHNTSCFKDCGDNCPVECVTWNEVHNFIKTLNWLTGKQYRLPTKAEWEYAARAGTTTKYCCGDEENCLDEVAWYWDNAGGISYPGIQPVGLKKPNVWGLYDMSGNVWEWCQDWYDIDYYSESQSNDPPGPNSGFERVVRGGNARSPAINCRSSNRESSDPSDHGMALGFRLCLDE